MYSSAFLRGVSDFLIYLHHSASRAKGDFFFGFSDFYSAFREPGERFAHNVRRRRGRPSAQQAAAEGAATSSLFPEMPPSKCPNSRESPLRRPSSNNITAEKVVLIGVYRSATGAAGLKMQPFGWGN